MEQEKVKMYVSVVNQQILNDKYSSPWEYEVAVSKDYIPVFEQLFEQMSRLEFRNFLRSHLPYVPYHFDRDNHDIDRRTAKIYALIHEFGDKETKEFVEQLPFFKPSPLQ